MVCLVQFAGSFLRPMAGSPIPPVVLIPGGRRTFFAEYMRDWTERGEIWSADVAVGQDPATVSFAPIVRNAFHMSYPFPFFDEVGNLCLTAETWQANRAMIWRRKHCGWLIDRTLLAGRPVLDPTLWRAPDRWWLFCTFRDDGPDSRLYAFHTPQLGMPWLAHSGNPVREDFSNARPAGPLFMVDGVLIRPAQDSSQTYGGALVLNAVRHLDPDRFEEEPIRHMRPIAGPYPSGLHTFCPAGDVTLIDGKTWRRDPWAAVNCIGKKIKTFATIRSTTTTIVWEPTNRPGAGRQADCAYGPKTIGSNELTS